MTRPVWPDLDRLARFLRVSDSLTGTLATWIGSELVVDLLGRVDDAVPDPPVAEAMMLRDGARVREQVVLVRCGAAVVATGRMSVAAGSPALREGDLLRSPEVRRSAVRVTVLRDRPAGDPTAPVLAVQARLDVGGTPVAWCEETVLEAVFADGRRARGLRAA